MDDRKPPVAGRGIEQRVNELEREYESRLADQQNVGELEELRFKLSGLLGRNNLNLLREYTDRLIALYNIDAGWFYAKGFKDAAALMRAKDGPRRAPNRKNLL